MELLALTHISCRLKCQEVWVSDQRKWHVEQWLAQKCAGIYLPQPETKDCEEVIGLGFFFNIAFWWVVFYSFFWNIMCTHIEPLHFRSDIWYFCLVCRQPALVIQRKAPNLHSLAAGSVYPGTAVCLPALNTSKKKTPCILQGRSRRFNKYYIAPVAYLAHAGPWASWITNAHNKILL